MTSAITFARASGICVALNFRMFLLLLMTFIVSFIIAPRFQRHTSGEYHTFFSHNFPTFIAFYINPRYTRSAYIVGNYSEQHICLTFFNDAFCRKVLCANMPMLFGKLALDGKAVGIALGMTIALVCHVYEQYTTGECSEILQRRGLS